MEKKEIIFPKENSPSVKKRFGVISDTQYLTGEKLDEALRPLHQLENEGIDLDLIVHLGDLSGSGVISKYAMESKKLSRLRDIQKREGNMSPEIEEYERKINDPDFRAFGDELKKRGVEQDLIIYALWLARERGELENALQDMKNLASNAAEQLSQFKTEVRHLIGNADRVYPERLKSILELLGEKNIVSYTQPIHMPLSEEASLVFWPSMKVGEGEDEQKKILQERIEQFANDMKNKKTVLIFTHETPFKGPKRPGAYEEYIEAENKKRAEKGEESLSGADRIPYKQFLPHSRYLLELCRRLPATTKIAIAAGHMHVPRETIEAGTKILKFDEEGKAPLRLFGGREIDRKKYEIIDGGRRTVDLYYLPEAEVGKFEILEDGSVRYEKLEKEK